MSFGLQSLPHIDLDNYSALPVDEGDEDRDAGIREDEDEGSDLDIGDDPSNTGMNHCSFFKCRGMFFRFR